MALAGKEDIRLALDLHAPWHRGHEHDHCYILRTAINDNRSRELFSRLLDAETHANTSSFPFWHDFVFNRYGVTSTPTFTRFWAKQPNVDLALCVETTYAGHYGYQTTQSSLVELGACISRVLRTMYGKV